MNRFIWIAYFGITFSIWSCNTSTNSTPPSPDSGEGIVTELADTTASAPTNLELSYDNNAYGRGGSYDFKLSVRKDLTLRKIVRNASLEIQVQNVESFLHTFEKDMTHFGAYSVSTNMYRNEGEINERIELKVPPQNLDSLILFLKNKSVFIRNYSTSMDDITTDYHDSQARLKTKKELEARYFEILKSAKKVSEILEVEEKLSEVRSDIESLEGQMKLYDHQVAFSSLSLNVYELIPVQKQPMLGFGSRLVSGFETGWHKLLGTIVSLTENWYWIALFLGGLFWYRSNRRKKAISKA